MFLGEFKMNQETDDKSVKPSLTDSHTPYSSTVGRKTSIAAGIALLLVGLPFLLLGAFGFFRIATTDIDEFHLGFAAVLFVIGVFCVSTAIRMMLGRKREDGGLFSPFVLRVAGTLFAIVPVLLIFADGLDLRSLGTLLKVGFFLAVAGSCFALASRRQYPVLGQDNTSIDKRL